MAGRFMCQRDEYVTQCNRLNYVFTCCQDLFFFLILYMGFVYNEEKIRILPVLPS